MYSDWLSTADTARRLKVQPRTVRYWITKRQIVAVRVGRDWMIPPWAQPQARKAKGEEVEN